ncbi:transposase family protein [Streptomyces johnsoniae]|uniref:Transposase family protein n=1 Tax=Streptomyces johnsoniae TaxID=3075532 RepID=A0ABU2S563_9ACTN|nr:transposase family protein [Streptomyces sp. DSM 41886]MDT0444052.1 transposase family protein [Streptomyces sp. DSM 41886]
MIPYAAMLDVPRHVVEYLARLLTGHRRRIGPPKSSRVLGPFRQAMLVLRWFREAGCVHCLARDAGISQATGYRYLHEGIDVLASQAPDLHEVLRRCHAEGMTHVVLDGTLVACDRVAGTTEKGNDLWYSGKAKHFAGNVQFIAAPDGTPLWVSDVEPGSVHDLTAARIHALPALYPAARDSLPTLADVGYTGAGIGIHTPFRPHPDISSPLAADNRTHNRLLRGIRALGERAAAELKQRWRALQHVTISPSRIGAIAKAALVLNTSWK